MPTTTARLRSTLTPDPVVQPSDPFGLGRLRDSILGSWLTSPTRLREDTAAETDLVGVGYRDRLLTELVANAADAATAAGIIGSVRVWHDGRWLHIANTGAPVDSDGAAALTALRSSSKHGDGLIGRFGVGFTAVAAVTRHVEIRSRTGSFEFSAERTRAELAANGVVVEQVPTLRLAWPIDTPPIDGFDTEVVMEIDKSIDMAAMFDGFAAESVQLLLELESIDTITLPDNTFRRVREGDIISVGGASWRELVAPRARWLLPLREGRPVRVRRDVLRAPTRTDVELTVPAICVGDVQLTADRRGLHPDADIAVLAEGYAQIVAELPIDQRMGLVPAPGFAAGRDDERLREALIAELAGHAWVPGAEGDDLIASRAEVLPDLTAGLADLLGEVITTLVHPDLSGRGSLSTLRSVGVTEIGLAEVAERLTGLEREPRWWGDLYAELSVVAQGQVDELGALPVPLADGRTLPGARGTVLPPYRGDEDADVVAPSWLPTVHPAANHDLLERLGAQRITVGEMLSDPALRAEIDEDPADERLVRSVLGLLRAAPDVVVPTWLGQLQLPADDDDVRPADELLLPGSPLSAVLIDDSPFGIVSADLVEEFGQAAFRALGVGWDFTVLREEYPTGPDHDLPDEEQWWSTLDDPPQTLSAVRDLDLVDPDRWPAALSLLVESADAATLLADRSGYTCWWLRHYAVVDGVPLGGWRAPSDLTVAGLLDPVDHPHGDELAGALGNADVEDIDAARLILNRLSAADRAVSPLVAATAHTALAEALRAGRIELDDVEPPTAARTLAGDVAQDAVVLDAPWLAAAIDPGRLITVVPSQIGLASSLADLLDMPLATEEFTAEPVQEGRPSTWESEPGALRSALMQSRPLPTGPIRVHDELVVEVHHDGTTSRRRVPFWRDQKGALHIDAEFHVIAD